MGDAALRPPMGESKPVSKRSCPLCQHPSRKELEEALLSGEISSKQLDKDMGWRLNTTDRHIRNHMGQFNMASKSAREMLATEIDAVLLQNEKKLEGEG